jgi:CxxC-x17-CxxC domain-containing protein
VNFVDKTLTCADCGADFTFSANDQAYHQERGFTNEPRRCPSCRASRRSDRGGGSSYSPQREMFTATCSRCGKEAQVPFQPRQDKPVYCSDCFRSQRPSYGASTDRGYGRRY